MLKIISLSVFSHPTYIFNKACYSTFIEIFNCHKFGVLQTLIVIVYSQMPAKISWRRRRYFTYPQ